jgi:Innexin
VDKNLKKEVRARAKGRSPTTGFFPASLTASYMGYKLYYLALCFAQLFVLNIFLGGSHDMFFGYRILRDLIAGRRWVESANFPRVIPQLSPSIPS